MIYTHKQITVSLTLFKPASPVQTSSSAGPSHTEPSTSGPDTASSRSSAATSAHADQLSCTHDKIRPDCRVTISCPQLSRCQRHFSHQSSMPMVAIDWEGMTSYYCSSVILDVSGTIVKLWATKISKTIISNSNQPISHHFTGHYMQTRCHEYSSCPLRPSKPWLQEVVPSVCCWQWVILRAIYSQAQGCTWAGGDVVAYVQIRRHP